MPDSDPVALTRKTSDDLLRHLYGSDLPSSQPPPKIEQRGDDHRFRPRNVFVNTSGEVIPAFAIMRVANGLAVDGDRYAINVAKPDGSTGVHVINGPREIAIDGRGSLQDASNHFVLLTDETTGTVGPEDDSWVAVPGSMFEVLGEVETGRALATQATSQQGVRLCVTNQVIQAGGSGAVTIWDDTVSPPVATSEIVEGVVLDWMHGDEQISAGRQAAFIAFGGVNRFMWSECEDG